MFQGRTGADSHRYPEFLQGNQAEVPAPPDRRRRLGSHEVRQWASRKACLHPNQKDVGKLFLWIAKRLLFRYNTNTREEKMKGNIEIKINLKKDWKFFVTLLVVVLAIVLFATYEVSSLYKLYNSTNKQKATGEIENVEQGMIVEEKFIAADNNLEKILLYFETYPDYSNYGGTVTVGIKDTMGEILKEETITRNHVRDSKTYELSFPKQKDSRGMRYTVYIKFEDLGEAKKFYTLAITNEDMYANKNLYINGEEQENSAIIYQELYKNENSTIFFVASMIFFSGLICAIATIIYSQKDMKPENVFLLIVPIIAILYILTMPSFKNHDEYWHWLKAFEVSEGHFMTPIGEDGLRGAKAPDGVSVMDIGDWNKITYNSIQELLRVKLDKVNTEHLDPYLAAFYSFVPYIPQSVGIFLTRLVTDSAYLMTYGGRIMNMLVAMTMLYFAIKLMPFGKKLLFIPAMIPIAIEGFSSLSADATTISMSFLFIAYVFHLAFGEKTEIKLKQKILLLIMSVVIALSKIVYLPLVGLILIIPKEKFSKGTNKSKAINFAIIAAIATIVNLVWLAIAGKYLEGLREGDTSIKIMMVLQNPIGYIQKMLATATINVDSNLQSLFGNELGWYEYVKIYSVVPYVFMAICAFVTATEEEIKNKLKRYQIVWILLVVLAIILLVYTSLYIQWTSIGSILIQGIQGRYFLPILPLTMLLLGNAIKKIHSTYDKDKVNKVIAVSGLLVNLFALIQIVVFNITPN